MKKFYFFIFLIVLSILCLLLANSLQAQTAKTVKYSINQAGKVIADSSKKVQAVKKPDQVYQIVNGTTFYKGSKGGIYYFAISKKTGLKYKRYIK